MTGHAVRILALVLAAAAGAYMLKIMHDIGRNMAHMTEEVSAMSAQMVVMGKQMEAISADVRRMGDSVERMGSTLDVGGKQMQRWNPMQMME